MAKPDKAESTSTVAESTELINLNELSLSKPEDNNFSSIAIAVLSLILH